MKNIKKYLVCALLVIFLYTGHYSILRITKYLVRQEFVTLTCSQEIQQKYTSDTGPVKEGHVSYEFESYRNQIGCGRIQKHEARFGENFILTFFYPLRELEMRIRGFNSSTLNVIKYVSEFERYTSNGNKAYFARSSLVSQFIIDRSEQRF